MIGPARAASVHKEFDEGRTIGARVGKVKSEMAGRFAIQTGNPG